MPQMFPMPFTFLMVSTVILFLISVIRSYWHDLGPSHSKEVTVKKSSSHFKQTW